MLDVEIDFMAQRTSWTKYDIVRALSVVDSIDTIKQYLRREIVIDEPILKSFLGIKTLKEPIPQYWISIQEYPKEKRLFAFLALLFTHGGIIRDFACRYSKGNLTGIFKLHSKTKQATNIRSALVESGAANVAVRRKNEVPYDLSPLLLNKNIGPLFKQLLLERLSRHTPQEEELSADTFYENCFGNFFNLALGLSSKQFKDWLEGKYIENITLHASETTFANSLICNSKNASIPNEHNLFGSLIGNWAFEYIDHRNSTEERHITGEWSFAWVLNGMAIQDVIIFAPTTKPANNPPPNVEYGTTLRIYNPDTTSWDILYGCPGVSTKLTAKASGSDIVLTDVATKHVLWIFSDITSTSFRLRNINTLDDNSTKLNCELLAVRNLGSR